MIVRTGGSAHFSRSIVHIEPCRSSTWTYPVLKGTTYFEGLLQEMKEETEKEISEAVDKAVTVKLQKMQVKLGGKAAEVNDEETRQLVEQLQDLMGHLEIGNTLEKHPLSNDITDGTVLSVQSGPSLEKSSKNGTKGRRR